VKRACALVRDHIAGAGRSLIAFLRQQLDDDMNDLSDVSGVNAPAPASKRVARGASV
jgi:hypothetical protein